MLRILKTCILVLLAGPLSATHIVGGEIYYTCLGNNQYRITLKVYRDCSANNTNNTQYDDPVTISIFNSTGNLFTTVDIPLPPVINLPVMINDPCFQAPATICVEAATYEKVVTLPASPGGYDLVYQRCCYNPGVLNVFNSFDHGNSYWAHIPGPSVVSCNSSPRFTHLPPLVICNGSHFEFDNSATDPDGDSLVYSLYTPFDGASPGNPYPVPASPPPYPVIPWDAGYSTGLQITGVPNLQINSSTGILTCIPNINGLHVFGVKVSEYRNGVLLSETYRNFQTTVTTCPAIVVSAIPVQSQFCQGLTLHMGNNSQNAQYYWWDFGDPNNPTADTSTAVSPSYTYADTGLYHITLIANPGLWCADTAYSDYTVYPPLSPQFHTVSPQCIVGQSFDFTPSGNFSTAASTDWTFANGNPNQSNQYAPQHVTFPSAGYHIVTFTVSEHNCTESVSDSVLVFPMPQIGWYTPDTLGCEPFTVHFYDTSFSWSAIQYLWNFGDGNFSTQANPVHTYLHNGVYSVSLTIETDSVCLSTQTLAIDSLVTVLRSPTAGFTMAPAQNSAFTPWVEVNDQSFGGIGQVFHFDDGYADSSVFVHHAYLESGYHPIIQYVTNELGCTDTAVHVFYVIPESTWYIPNAFTPDGDGLNDVFIPVIKDVTEYHFYIFDRWGQIIYRSETTGQGWDGTRRQKQSPVDTYVYLVEFRDANGIEHVLRGHVTLVR